MKKFEQKVKANSYISARTVILIDENGNKLGSVNNSEAQQAAQQKGLDLIEISHNAAKSESVCRIGDLSKFLYDKKKKEKEQDRLQRQSTVETKEIQLRPTTGSHDLEIKAKKCLNFLEDGSRVKVVLQMFGRQISHKDIGEKTLEEFMKFISSEFIEQPKHYEGNSIVVVLYKKKS